MTIEAVRRMGICISLLLGAGLAFAQDSQPGTQSPGWRRIGDPAPETAQAQNPEPIAPAEPAGGEPQAQPAAQPQPQAGMPADPHAAAQPTPYGLPAVLTIKPGTFVTIRVNEPLSSDRSRPGDGFSGTLAQPLVVDGVVAAQRGQVVYGTVAESEKAHADSPSRWGCRCLRSRWRMARRRRYARNSRRSRAATRQPGRRLERS